MRVPFSRRALFYGLALIATRGRPDAAEFESRTAFRDEVIDIGRRHFPGMPFTPGEGVITSGGHTLYLDNIRHAVRQLPPSMRETAIVDWLRRFTPEADRAVASVRSAAETWDGAKPMLRPRLMPRASAERIPSLINEAFQDDLVIFYTIDLGDKDLYVRTDTFARWKVSQAQVHDAAIANLEKLSASIPLEPASYKSAKGRYLMVSQGDGYDASRILLPEFRKRLLALLGPILFVAVPAKDLMVCWSADFAFPEAMMGLVKENASSLPQPVSTQIFALTERGLDRVFLAEDDADAMRQAARHP